MTVRLEHMPRNGAALAGLGAAAAIIAKHIWACQYDMASVCARTGLNAPVVLRFLNDHVATEHTLRCFEVAFHVQLPRPKAALYRLAEMHAKWCGFEYEITDESGGVMKSWRRGSERDVRQHAERVIARAHRQATVLA